jgi:nucleotide-binding universal stress UspA family protein
MKADLHLFTNGSEENWPSIEYAAWIAGNMKTRITLTGILEPAREEFLIEEMFSRAVSLFQGKGIDYSLELSNEQAEETIAKVSEQRPKDLLLFGPFGRPQLRRLVVGRSFRQIMARVRSAMLYVPVARLPLRKILICMGGLSYTLTVEHLGLRVAQMTGASVTLLTVVPPVDLDYPEARVIRENWQRLAETDTLPGKNLREGLSSAASMGVTASVRTRNGIIVEEILEEIKTGDYDLACMGSSYSAQGLRHLYTSNVTAEVAEAGLLPILTARYQKEA